MTRLLAFLLAFLLVFAALAAPAGARTPIPPAEIPATQLPAQARETLALIKRGGPFPYRKDGAAFHNREKRLAPRPPGYYREYTVPTPGARDRGPRRIVAGGGARADVRNSGEYYYTDDHYRSFKRIRE